MRVLVSKPKNGRVTVVVDDVRGVTGDRVSLQGVEANHVVEQVTPVLEAWRGKKDRIRQARRGASV